MKSKFVKLAAIATLGFFSIGLSAATVNLEKSEVKWKADKKIGSGHYGTVAIEEATATLKDGKIQKGKIVMDMTNITVTDLSGKMATKFIGHIGSGDFFENTVYKTATLEITEQVGKNKVKGNLTIKKTTNPVVIDFKKDKKTFTGKFVFDRTKWDIKYGSGTFMKALQADKIIKDDVELDFTVVLN